LESRIVSSYLSHLRKLGLVQRDGYGIWSLTEAGRKLIDSYEEAIYSLEHALKSLGKSELAKFVSFLLETKKIRGNPRKSEEIQGNQRESGLLTVLRRAEQLLGRRISETERALIVYLYDFTQKSRRKYWWPPEPVPLSLALTEELRSSGIDASPSELSRVLRELEARGVIHLQHDRRRGVVKVRLSRALGV